MSMMRLCIIISSIYQICYDTSLVMDDDRYLVSMLYYIIIANISDMLAMVMLYISYDIVLITSKPFPMLYSPWM